MPLIKRKQTNAASGGIQDASSAHSTGHERRSHGRIIKPTALTIFTRHPGLRGKLLQPDGIKVLDFSRFGLAFESTHKYKVGEELSFEISEHSNQVNDVIGFVTHLETLEKSYRCGIQFDFSANAHMRSVELEEALTQMELNLLATTKNP